MVRYVPYSQRRQLAEADAKQRRGAPQKLDKFSAIQTNTICRTREDAEDIAAFKRRRAPVHGEHVVVRVVEITPHRRQRKEQPAQLMDLAVQLAPEGRRVDRKPYRSTKFRPPDEKKGPAPPDEEAGR
jgi:hypothetical protein